MTIDRRKYSGPNVLDEKVEKTVPAAYLNRLKQMPSAAYLLNPQTPGQLHCAKRGKLMVMAAGNVSALLTSALNQIKLNFCSLFS